MEFCTKMNDEQLKQINALRNHFGDRLSAFYGTDFTLLHWIEAWNGKLDEIIPRLENHIAYRKVMELDDPTLCEDNTSNQNGQIMHKLSPYFSGCGLRDSYDRDGNSVCIVHLGGVDYSSMLKRLKVSDFFRQQMAGAECGRRGTARQEARTGKLCGSTMVYDLSGLQIGKSLKDVVGGPLGKFMHLVQDHYPESINRMIVVNVPKFVHILWNILRHFMAKKTQEKVVFLHSNWQREIHDYIAPECLPKAYGGSQEDTTGQYDPLTMRRPAEPFPEDWPVAPTPENLAEIGIRPGATFVLQYDVREPTDVKWYFQANGDLHFGIFITSGDDDTSTKEMVIPRFVLSTHWVAESGQVTCSKVGRMTVEFENKSSYIFSVHLHYQIAVKPASADSDIILQHLT